MGFFDTFGASNLDPSQNVGVNMPMLSLLSALGEASAPTRVPTSTAQVFGDMAQGLMKGQQAQQQQQTSAMENQQKAMQMGFYKNFLQNTLGIDVGTGKDLFATSPGAGAAASAAATEAQGQKAPPLDLGGASPDVAGLAGGAYNKLGPQAVTTAAVTPTDTKTPGTTAALAGAQQAQQTQADAATGGAPGAAPATDASGLPLTPPKLGANAQQQAPFKVLKPAPVSSMRPVANSPVSLNSWHPSQYDGTIAQAAQQFGLDPMLFKRQLYQESGLDPTRRSSAGAAGIAQIMPDTAANLKVDPWNPTQSIFGAARYMRSILDGPAQGDYAKALAGYNWGPGNIQKYAAGRMPQETRNYVKSIMGGSGQKQQQVGPQETAAQMPAGGAAAQAPAGEGGDMGGPTAATGLNMQGIDLSNLTNPAAYARSMPYAMRMAIAASGDPMGTFSKYMMTPKAFSQADQATFTKNNPWANPNSTWGYDPVSQSAVEITPSKLPYAAEIAGKAEEASATKIAEQEAPLQAIDQLVPGGSDGIVKQMLQYKIPAPQIGGRNIVGAALVAKAQAVDPTYDPRNSAAYANIIKQYGSQTQGAPGAQMRFINNAFGHSELFEQYVNELAKTNWGQRPTNELTRLSQEIAVELRRSAGPKITSLTALKQFLGPELAKSVVSSGGGQEERLSVQNTLDQAQSPEQILGVLQTFRNVLGRQMQGLAQGYNVTGLKDFEKFVAPDFLSTFRANLPIPKLPSGVTVKAVGQGGVILGSDNKFYNPDGTQRQ
jgi:soluble lytic murein transglycosylase-like protein